MKPDDDHGEGEHAKHTLARLWVTRVGKVGEFTLFFLWERWEALVMFLSM